VAPAHDAGRDRDDHDDPSRDHEPSTLDCVISGEASDALRTSDAMRSGSDAFGRTADAIAGLAAGDREGYGVELVRAFG
jgi:hypothetical protein